MDNQTALMAVQQRFSLIRLNGQYSVLDNKEIERARKGEFRADIGFFEGADARILLKRHLQTLPIPCEVNSVISDFWDDPNTVEYSQTAFSPEPQSADSLNFWVGQSIVPIEGDARVIKYFIRNVICAGDLALYKYLMKFLAHMLQKPEDKPGICIVLIGGQGVGKGAFFRLLACIWGVTTLHANDIDQVVGRFNAALERNYVVCMDEALFVGDKKSLSRLKSVVTEPVIRIEQKYQPSRTIESYQRFFAATNHEHFAHVEHDDRRFLFLKVSDVHQQDTEYFGALYKSFRDGHSVGAFVDELMKESLVNFDVRSRPLTAEHLRQRLKSLENFERYWYEVLRQGEITGYEFAPIDWFEPVFVSTSTLVKGYKHANKNAERYATVQSEVIAATLLKVCPSAKKTRSAEAQSTVRKRGYELPHISVARSDFDRYLGCIIDWT